MMSRWFGVAGGLFIQICAGTAYAFGCYSKELKSALSLTQAELLQVSSIGNIGMYVGIIGGIVYDKVGPRWTCVCGALISATGYSLIFYATTMGGHGNDSWFTTPGMLAVLFAIAWNGSAFLDGSVVSSSIKNFPSDRGLVLGLIKAFFGLSASMIAQIYTSFFKQSTTQKPTSVPMMVFLAAIQIVVVFALLPTQVVLPEEASPISPKGRRRLFQGYGVVVILSLYLAVVSVVQAGWHQPLTGAQHDSTEGFTVGMIVIMSLLAFLPFGAEPDAQSKFRNGEQETLLNKQYVGSTNRAPPTARTSLEDLNTMEMLCRPNFWLLFLSVLMGMGAGLMTINNVSGIVGSLDPSEPVSVYVTIIGVSNCLGRMIGGVTADNFKHVATRPLCFVASLTVMGVAMLVLMAAVGGCADKVAAVETDTGSFSGSSSGVDSCSTSILYPGFALVGLAYGSFWSISPAIVSELFGLSHIGANYQMMSIAPASGGYIFSAVLAAHFYTKQETCYTDTSGKECTCHGAGCYETTFLVTAAAQGLAALIALVLWWRSRSFYHQQL